MNQVAISKKLTSEYFRFPISSNIPAVISLFSGEPLFNKNFLAVNKKLSAKQFLKNNKSFLVDFIKTYMKYPSPLIEGTPLYDLSSQEYIYLLIKNTDKFIAFLRLPHPRFSQYINAEEKNEQQYIWLMNTFKILNLFSVEGLRHFVALLIQFDSSNSLKLKWNLNNHLDLFGLKRKGYTATKKGTFGATERRLATRFIETFANYPLTILRKKQHQYHLVFKEEQLLKKTAAKDIYISKNLKQTILSPNKNWYSKKHFWVLPEIINQESMRKHPFVLQLSVWFALFAQNAAATGNKHFEVVLSELAKLCGRNTEKRHELKHIVQELDYLQEKKILKNWQNLGFYDLRKYKTNYMDQNPATIASLREAWQCRLQIEIDMLN